MDFAGYFRKPKYVNIICTKQNKQTIKLDQTRETTYPK